ncbi:glycine cleavage system protein H [Paenibacillus yonginensis]|uniref:Glycine cleavage system H protein n=1 Tax=Paenibacillus yonginensis TaxID=1462996 RepID=A0A1B1N054_9BACL|nr:glycine cleavage system protein GcvH [Paenibacillus yonginensis]ANS74807.1 glycine cleavage system protein H [Paenibacillus yonginensis]
MSEIKQGLWYSEEHEWVQDMGDGTVLVGITDFAQDRLGDIVFVELPETGTEVGAEDGIGTIESVKTVSDLFSPVSGTIVEVNEELTNAPERVNEAPFGSGWMVKIKLSASPDEAFAKLMNAEAYGKHIDE